MKKNPTYISSFLTALFVFLVCDSVPTTGVQPTHYVMEVDGGTEFTVPVQTLPDGSVRLHYDLTPYSEGSYAFRVKAARLVGGELNESDFVPFDYTRSRLDGPGGLALSIE